MRQDDPSAGQAAAACALATAPPPALAWPRATGTVLDLVGGTPTLQVHGLVDRPGIELYIKLERFNPGGSIKDRPATMMVLDGIGRCELRPGMAILESTSGNTGLALALIGRALGYPVTICMSAAVSRRCKQTLQAMGAEVVVTDAAKGSDGAMQRAMELHAASPGRYFFTDQYANPANVWAHYLSTAPEIWRQTGGRITHLVAPIGTSGTVMGTGMGLRERNPAIQVIAVEPDEADHGLFGMRHIPSTIRPAIYRADGFDRLRRVPTREAYRMARWLASDLGLLLGPSSAAALIAASEVAAQIDQGVVVAVCPDGGGHYLSSEVFRRRTARVGPAGRSAVGAARQGAGR